MSLMTSATQVWFELQGLRQQFSEIPETFDELGNPMHILNPRDADPDLWDRIKRLNMIYKQFTMEERAIAISADPANYPDDSWAQNEFHTELDKTAHIRHKKEQPCQTSPQ